MFWQNKATQAVPSACSRWPPVGKGALRSKTPMLSSPRKPPSKRLLPKRFLAVHPPTEIRRQLPEHSLKKIEIGLATQRLLHSVEKDRCPGLYRGIDVAEVPLIGRNLSCRVQVHLAKQQVELLLGEIDVDGRQGEGVKG
jgi:hypothetical protein